MQETWAWSPDWENSLEKKMVTHSSILAWGNSMDRGAWWATVHVVTESDTTDRLTISLSLFTLGRSHAIHAISQYFKCEYTSSEFRSICAFVHWVELVAILVPNVWLCHQICVMEPFILWDSFLPGKPHSFTYERIGEIYHHSFFFCLWKEWWGGGNTSHHSNLSTAGFYVLFLLFSTHCEFLRLHSSHSPAKRDNALLSSFSLPMQWVTGCVTVSLRRLWHCWDFYARKKITPCAFPWTALHMQELTEVPKVRHHT